MDTMLQHPGTELQVLIKEKGLTQKAFASILGKKISEVNELLKGKRNITIQRDYLLHQALGTPMKYWILKQVDYDYSLLDIEETNKVGIVPSPHGRGLGGGSEGQGEVSSHQISHSERSEESTTHQTRHSEHSEESRINNLASLDSSTSLRSSLNDNITQSEDKSQETPIPDHKIEDDEDLKTRADIFRSF